MLYADKRFKVIVMPSKARHIPHFCSFVAGVPLTRRLIIRAKTEMLAANIDANLPFNAERRSGIAHQQPHL